MTNELVNVHAQNIDVDKHPAYPDTVRLRLLDEKYGDLGRVDMPVATAEKLRLLLGRVTK